jgi:gluconate 2-dehydrogenase gamma chain
MPEEKDGLSITRRTLLAGTAGAAFVPLTAIAPAVQAAPAPEPMHALSAAQRRTLESFLDRLCPEDELGPGAVGCGAAEYIDRQLAEYLFAEKQSFIDGLAAVEAYSIKTQSTPFVGLSEEKRDLVIGQIEEGKATDFPILRGFFNRARRLMLEGMFGDPHYGGNKNFSGWDLIKYPGPRLAVAPEDQRMSVPAKPYRRSAWGEHDGH